MFDRKNIIEILELTSNALAKENALKIKELSDRTIHNSSLTKDPDEINLAVILYSISKMIERPRYRELPGWTKFEKTCVESVNNATIALKRNEIEIYRDQINRIKDLANKLTGYLKDHLKEIIRRAQISKASRIYEHGLSRESAAKILGISQWELNQYVGQTGIADVNLAYTLDIKERIKIAEEIFK